MKNKRQRKWWVLLLTIALLAGLACFFPGCAIGYVAKQGYYQGKLLAGRIEVEEALERPDLSDAAKAKLRLIQEIRHFGEEKLGMSPTDNYTTVNLDWNQSIWNVSACRELEFEAYTWWFPIVGTVPYKGFFRKEDAMEEETELLEAGYDTLMREVGGYSTLGWFRDPILPSMLRYSEETLANLVLHELAHATLFIPGEVDFNESFASFVGNEAMFRFLAERYGEESEKSQQARARYADRDIFNKFMHGLYESLDEVYKGAGSDEEKRQAKADILSGLSEKLAKLPFQSQLHQKFTLSEINNANLMQHRRYGSAKHHFARLLERCDGDMKRFFDVCRAIGDESGNPFGILEQLAEGGMALP